METFFERTLLEGLSGKGCKYTCIDARGGILTLGSATGSLYFYDSSTLRLLEMFSEISKTTPITRIRISPDIGQSSKCIAVASESVIYVVSANFSSARDKQKVLLKSSAHKETKVGKEGGTTSPVGPEITALEWDSNGEKLYSGDDIGNVFVTQVNGIATKLFGSQLLVKLGLRIVQLVSSVSTSNSALLLASDTAKTVLIDTFASKSSQVGKQLRNGAFGACFHPLQHDTLLLARPNLRVWVASISGGENGLPKVEKTLKFEQTQQQQTNSNFKNLGKMIQLSQDKAFVVSWATDGSGIALLDVDKPALLENVMDIISPTDDVVADIAASQLFILSNGSTIFRLSIHGNTPKSLPMEIPQTSTTEQTLSSTTNATTATAKTTTNTNIPIPSSVPNQQSHSIVSTSLPTVISQKNQQQQQNQQTQIQENPLVLQRTDSLGTASIGTPLNITPATTANTTIATSEEIVPIKKKKSAAKKRVAPVMSPADCGSRSQFDSAQLSSTPPLFSRNTSLIPSPPSSSSSYSVGKQEQQTTNPNPTNINLQQEKQQQQQQQQILPITPRSTILKSKSFSLLASKMKILLPEEFRSLIDKRSQIIAPSSSPSLTTTTQQKQQISPPTEGDSKMEFPSLSEKAYNVLCSCVEGVASHETLKPWLDLWLKTALVVSSMNEKACPNIPIEIAQQLSTACFELQIGAPIGSKNQESLSIQLVNELGTVLIPRRCSFACSEWHWIECLREILSLYRVQQPQDPILSLLESNDASAVVSLFKKTNCDDLGLFLLVLPELANLAPKITATFCATLSQTILPWHIREFSYNQKFFLKYLGKLFKAHPKLLLEEPKLVDEWFELMLQYKNPNKNELFAMTTNPEEMTPAPKSHLQLWGYHVALMNVIDSLTTEDKNISRIEHLTILCKTFGFWPGLIRLLSVCDKKEETIKLVIELDDCDLLVKLLSREQNISQTIWQNILSFVLLSTQKSNYNNKINNSKSITVEKIIEIMLAYCGPILVADIISTVPNGITSLTPNVMKNILRVGRVTLVEQPNVVRNLLSTVDSYLWSKRPWVTNPQLRAVAELEASSSSSQEIQSRLNSLPFVQISQQQQQQQQQNKSVIQLIPAFDSPNLLQSTYEEASNSHWGVSSNIIGSVCAFCSLPLIIPDESAALLLRPGLSKSVQSGSNIIVVFPHCGHSYHQSCLGNDACILCLHSNFTSISKPRFL